MSTWTKLSSTLVVCVLLFHVAMTVVYLSPANLLKAAFGSTSSAYMGRFFYQNWHLFSPNPGISTTRLWIRCQGDRAWGGWVEPTEKLQTEYYANRISGKGKVLYVYNGISKNLVTTLNRMIRECGDVNATCDTEEIQRRVKDSGSYDLASRYAEGICRSILPTPSAIKYQFKLMTFQPKQFSRRHNEKLWSSVSTVEFAVENSPKS